MPKLYVASLADAERLLLEQTVKDRRTSPRKATQARILLKSDAGPEGPEWSDTKIAEAFEVSRQTVERLPKRAVTEGVEAALQERRHGTVRPKLTGENEARLTALRCSDPQTGQKRWSLHVLADHFSSEEGISVSYELVRHTLKKPIVPAREGAVVHLAGAECGVLLAHGGCAGCLRPYDARYPQVCFDERPTQLLADVREPLPARPGRPAREDYEYERKGTANLFLWYEPLQNRRHVEATEHRRRDDWAHCTKALVDVHYPDAERIVLVLDNLNIHSPASLYVACEPKEAKRLADKLELHYTPKHGSWLNMAEIDLAILSNQCLDRRLPTTETLASEVAAWEKTRNEAATRVNWRFTTADARIKLRHLYPTYYS